jgi:hypothetical protein
VPLLFSAAGRLEPPGPSLAAAFTLGYTGFIVGPAGDRHPRRPVRAAPKTLALLVWRRSPSPRSAAAPRPPSRALRPTSADRDARGAVSALDEVLVDGGAVEVGPADRRAARAVRAAEVRPVDERAADREARGRVGAGDEALVAPLPFRLARPIVVPDWPLPWFDQ